MKYSTRLSDTVHIAAFIPLSPTQDLSSGAIAHSIRPPPLLCAPAHVGAEAGRTAARHERAGRPSLSRELSAITPPDIYQAAEGDKPLLHPDARTNPECGAGVNIRLALSCCCAEVQQSARPAWRRSLCRTS